MHDRRKMAVVFQSRRHLSFFTGSRSLLPFLFPRPTLFACPCSLLSQTRKQLSVFAFRLTVSAAVRVCTTMHMGTNRVKKMGGINRTKKVLCQVRQDVSFVSPSEGFAACPIMTRYSPTRCSSHAVICERKAFSSTARRKENKPRTTWERRSQTGKHKRMERSDPTSTRPSNSIS